MLAPNDQAQPVLAEPGFVEFVVLVACMMAITAFGIDSILPALPTVGLRFAVTDANHLQYVVSAYMAGFGIMQLVYGPISDIAGRRPAFMAGIAIYAAGCVLSVLAPDYTTLLLSRFVQGAGAAAGRVLAIAIVRDRFAGREMARVMSLTTVVFIMVPVFAPAVGSLILLAGGWKAVFGTMLALSVLLLVWFRQRMPETLRPEYRMAPSLAPVANGVRLTVTNPVAMGYSTAFGLMFACIMSYVGSAQQIFGKDVYGLGAWFTLVFGGIAVMMGLAGFTNSLLVRRHGMHRLAHAAMLALLALSLAIVALSFAYRGRPPLLAFAGLLGLSQFAVNIAMANFNALAIEPLGRVAGTASSFMGFYTTTIGAGLGLVIGQFYDGTVLPLGIGYVGLALGVILVVLATERGRLFRATHERAAS